MSDKHPIDTLTELLNGYECRHTHDVSCIDSGLPLVDKLTPPDQNSITLGKEEIKSLAEYIYDNSEVFNEAEGLRAEVERLIATVREAYHETESHSDTHADLCTCRCCYARDVLRDALRKLPVAAAAEAIQPQEGK